MSENLTSREAIASKKLICSRNLKFGSLEETNQVTLTTILGGRWVVGSQAELGL